MKIYGYNIFIEDENYLQKKSWYRRKTDSMFQLSIRW